jgi:membrane protease YdiL (CAAX protease family)
MRPVTSVAGRGPRIALRLILLTYLAVRAFWSLSAVAGRSVDSVTAEAALKVVLWVPICAVTVWLLGRSAGTRPLVGLGIRTGLFRGIALGVVATFPMLVAAALLPRKGFVADLVVGSALLGPFAEELLFHGLLFRQLISGAGWSVTAAVVVSSLAFGLAHVPNIDLGLLTAVRFGWLPGIWHGWPPLVWNWVLPYAAGGAVFAWLTYRWNSLWPAMALHGLMNFWWDLTTGEHAQLDFHLDAMSVAQALSAALAIVLTLRATRSPRASSSFHVDLSSRVD